MIQLKVDGVAHTFDGDPEMPLRWYSRDILGLTGTKFGSGIALYGASTAHKNDEARRACITPMTSLAGAEIRTIEDISANGLHPVQEMWMQFNTENYATYTNFLRRSLVSQVALKHGR
jgi:isoquinoline 1-oxidoreductase alpha subunit